MSLSHGNQSEKRTTKTTKNERTDGRTEEDGVEASERASDDWLPGKKLMVNMVCVFIRQATSFGDLQRRRVCGERRKRSDDAERERAFLFERGCFSWEVKKGISWMICDL